MHKKYIRESNSPVREPLLQRRNGGNVGNTKTSAANDTVADVQEPQLLGRDGEGSGKLTNEVKRKTEESTATGTDTLHPGTEDGSARAEAGDGDLEQKRIRRNPVEYSCKDLL